MGFWSKLFIKIGLPPFTCPECGNKGGEWNKDSPGRSLLLNRPKVLGPGWSCPNCRWKT